MTEDYKDLRAKFLSAVEKEDRGFDQLSKAYELGYEHGAQAANPVITVLIGIVVGAFGVVFWSWVSHAAITLFDHV